MMYTYVSVVTCRAARQGLRNIVWKRSEADRVRWPPSGGNTSLVNKLITRVCDAEKRMLHRLSDLFA